MDSTLVLALQSEESPVQIAQLARELKTDLRRNSDIEVQEVTVRQKSGERAADISLIGQFALTFLTSGAAIALVNCLKAYIGRDHTLRFRFTRSDGSHMELEGKQLDESHFNKSLKILEDFVSGRQR